MKAFDHYTPQSINEAIELISNFNGTGIVIAGGTDVHLKMKTGLVSPEAVINIKQIPELKGLTYDKKKGARIGALTTLRELTRSPDISGYYPALCRAAGLMASEQIRSFATIGGNLCNAAPSADLAPPLIALNGQMTIIGKSRSREIFVEDFFSGPGSTTLSEGELVQEITIPPPTGKTIFIKHSPREYMDISVVCIALNIELVDGTCKDTKIVLGAVAPTPLRIEKAEKILIGQKITSAAISKAAAITAKECSPIDDVRGSAAYRRRMVEVLTRRGLTSLLQAE